MDKPMTDERLDELEMIRMWNFNHPQRMELIAEIRRLREELERSEKERDRFCDKLHIKMDEHREIERKLAEARELFEEVVDYVDEKCWYDHHGYCQAHGLQPKGECFVELIVAWLKNPAVQAAKEQGDE